MQVHSKALRQADKEKRSRNRLKGDEWQNERSKINKHRERKRDRERQRTKVIK